MRSKVENLKSTIFRVQEPFIFTIFGASGDLAKLKIFPALFALAEQKRFPKNFIISGYARTEMAPHEFRDFFTNSVKSHYLGIWSEYQDEILKDLLNHVHYFFGQYDRREDFQNYQNFLKTLEIENIPHLSYFSVPPFVVEPIMRNLAEVFDSKKSDLRLILEKPFGVNENSARELFHQIYQFYRDDQLYLLDHYLGKKAVRSLLPLRHMNRILNSMLKGKEIANIQISVLEPMGVGERIGYFDAVGTIKDVIQSHLLQILAMLTMSIPIKITAEHVQEEKTAILSALDFPENIDSVATGQYQEYKLEHEKTKNSDTETFAALRFWINRETWHDVPIFLRSGKKIGTQKQTFLVVELKKFSFQASDQEPNRVIIEFFPEEKIQIRLLDEDGATLRQGEISASHSLACQGDYCLPEHGLLFLDVIRNEKRYFLSIAEILASWRIVDRVLDFVRNKKIKPEIYDSGSRGPKNQGILMKNTNFSWYNATVQK